MIKQPLVGNFWRVFLAHWKYCQVIEVWSSFEFSSDMWSWDTIVIKMITCIFFVLENYFSEDYKYDYSGVAPANQTKERAKTKSSWIRPFLWILVLFFGKTSTIHIELLFRNAPAKSSWTDLSLVWFAGATPELHYCALTDLILQSFNTSCRKPSDYNCVSEVYSTLQLHFAICQRRQVQEALCGVAGVLRGNTIRGHTTRNSERKMALWEGLWEGLWKTSENL